MPKLVQKYHWVKPRAIFLIYIFIFLFVSMITYKQSMYRLNSFGCFDDCFNFVAGYFIANGKQLYREIFFNHQPIPAYISAVIQTVTNPTNIYELILRHRQFVFFYSFIWGIVLIYRFRLSALLFIIGYELTKYYVFGTRFLGESLTVYPLVYISGIVLHRMLNKNVSMIDYILGSICLWFVLFTREPFIFIVVVLFIALLYLSPVKQYKHILTVILFVLSAITFLVHPLSDYLFNVITVNRQSVLSIEMNGYGLRSIFEILLYPYIVLLHKPEQLFWVYLYGLSLLFLFLTIVLLYKKQYRLLAVSYLILILINLRPVEAGTVYYSAFHILNWYGLFIWILMYILTSLYIPARLKIIGVILYITLLVYVSLHPSSWLRERIDQHSEHITNYGLYINAGNVFKILSNPTDRIFIDGADDLIYWQAQRLSGYPYSWYTSLMPKFQRYTSARDALFGNNPPEFYYGSCKESTYNTIYYLSEEILKQYDQLSDDSGPSCIYIRKDITPTIDTDIWKQVNEMHFYK